MKKQIKKVQGIHKGFRLRGLENTRVESLSDGVFAIAIGLLLISSSAPKTFDELNLFVQDFIPFAVTISLLMIVWYQHYIFFIRYGLRDVGTVVLNTILLFLVLFYVYPLKFMIGILVEIYRGLIINDTESLKVLFTDVIKPSETPKLMVLYGLGAAGVFLVLFLLNRRALMRKGELKLSPIEIIHTKNTIRVNLVSGLIPLLSALIAFIEIGDDQAFMISGFVYILYAVAMPLVSRRGRRRLKKVEFGTE